MTIVTQLRNCVENSFKDNQFSTYGLNRLPLAGSGERWVFSTRQENATKLS
jgi:hypothetical protein